MAEVRRANNEDARRELAVEMFKRCVRERGPDGVGGGYDPDIEYLENAIVAFADEWASRDLAEVRLVDEETRDV